MPIQTSQLAQRVRVDPSTLPRVQRNAPAVKEPDINELVIDKLNSETGEVEETLKPLVSSGFLSRLF